MRRFLMWVFWNVYYVVRKKPATLEDFIASGTRRRTRWPWWKFKPHLWHNNDGKQWEVWFSDEECFSQHSRVPITRHIGFVSKQIVGFTVWDDTLENPERHLDVESEAIPEKPKKGK